MAVFVFECSDCGVTSPPITTSGTLSKVDRGHVCGEVCPHCRWRHPRRGSRGLCGACHADPTIRADYPTKFRWADDLLDDWDMLRRQGHTLRQAADRLGITYAAQRAAVVRQLLDAGVSVTVIRHVIDDVLASGTATVGGVTFHITTSTGAATA